jgi:CubicO group peptidase (beta-lactamase class C family)
MAASAPDLARWVRALYGGRVLPAATIQEMVDDAARTAALKVGRSYGLGVEVIAVGGQPSYGHGGRLVGAQSVVRWFPDQGVAIAVVTNQSRFDPQLVLEQLLAVAAPRTMYPVPRAA